MLSLWIKRGHLGSRVSNELGAFVPRNTVGQRGQRGREQNEEPPIDQAQILAGRAHHLSQGGNVEIFVVSNELLKTNSNKFKMFDDNVVVHKESIRLLLE